MAPRTRGTTENKQSARDVLEQIALQIYNQEKKKTIPYERELKGKLSKAKFADRLYKESNGGLRSAPSDACSLKYQFHTNNTIYSWDERNPCFGRNQDRFSEDQESECGNKIRDYKSENVGTSCAPPRRRHMCDQNLEFLDNDHTDDTDDLLGNVLVTAKYEGESIVSNHPDKDIKGNKSSICTSLARSFADIGDIVRGRDMFKSNDKVENGLKKVFDKIYNKLGTEGKKYYNDTNNNVNYAKLREDWWKVNRDQVWKAITCKAPKDADYFRKGSNGESIFSDSGPCGRNETDVPTYLDYVPQYLRWYDEWAEEFCRKKKIKLENVKKACRDEENGKYCSLNGFDCTETIWKKGIFGRGNGCTDCSFKCFPYESWIDNQRKQFLKQKNKYADEINGTSTSSRKKRAARGGSDHKGYEKKFYEQLKEKNKYGTVDAFLELLNKEKACTAITDNDGGTIDFKNVDRGKHSGGASGTNDKTKGTFYRSEYCQVCPDCGVKCTNGTCKPKDKDNDCETNDVYEPPRGVKPTDINVLYSGDEHGDITQKLKDFCTDPSKDMGKNDETWKCYYNNKQKKNNNNICILQPNKNITHRYIMNFDNFIQFWVRRLLIDTIDWDRKLKTCINNNNNDKCISGCNEDCMCFDKWVGQKEKEWKSVKEHIAKEKENERKKYCDTLKDIFSDYYFQVIEKIYKGNQKWKERIKKVENVECSKVNIGTNDSQDQIDTFFRSVKEGATQCTTKNPQSACDNPHAARKITPASSPNPSDASIEKSGKTESVEEVCKDVKKYITENNEKTKNQTNTGCNKKGNSKKWECENTRLVPGRGECMPPRRQTLCIYYLSHDKENINIETAEKLKDGVMKSAALETHFLWEKYKTDKNGGNSGKTLDDQLKEGNIPEDFKRQMFYTYGDYRDLFFGTDISNHRYIIAVKKNVNNVLSKSSSEKKFNLNNIKNEWWNEHGKEIWKAMLCALTNGVKENDEKKKILEAYSYETLNKATTNGTNTLENFAKKPQFLRWMIEWGEEFCAERKRLEHKVVEDCKVSKEYDGCKNNKGNGNDNCVNACKAYNQYITDKKTQYDKQKKKFEAEKTSGKAGYKNYSKTEASEYLINECLNSACNCMKKVTEISNYWTNPHKTYDDDKLGIKCQCPPPPCTIVDAILGDKTSKSYAEGCRHKYKTRGLEGWLCNDKEGEKGKEDGLCIPPRRQRLYVKDLEELKDENPSHESLREAFIKSAAVETFFSWHEFKKEKEKEEKEQANLIYISTGPNKLDEQLEKGKIDDEFKRQMFYTLADYRDILFGKDMSKDMGELNDKINKVFANNGKKPSVKTQQQFWELYGKDIWDGMICALSYDTETKIKNEQLRKKLTENDYKYDMVTFEGGLHSDKSASKTTTITTKLENFVKRPQFFRWLEEWGEEFCRKKNHKLKRIKDDCRKDNNSRQCDDDGFECKEMCPKKDGTFESFTCLSCAKSCKSYKKWINEKNIEFEKQREKYKTQIKKLESNPDNIYDENFVKDHKIYKSVDSFLNKLKGTCSNNDNEHNKIDFENTDDTFRHSTNCVPCPKLGVKCKNGDCRADTKEMCGGKNFNAAEDIIDEKDDIGNVNMLVSDNSANGFKGDLGNVYNRTGIFTGIREDKWSCGYLCGLDVCSVKTSHGGKDGTKNILIRALFKRWLENFLEDYNKINEKISHCINNDERSKCINGCKNKCNCLYEWINKKREEWKIVRKRFFNQYNVDHSDIYTVKSFLQQGPFHDDVQKAIKPSTDLNEFEKSTECTDSNSSAKGERKKKDVVECLLDKLQKEINGYQNQHTGTDETSCSEASPIPPNTLDIPPDIAPIFCNMPPNPCSDKNDTNIVSVTQVAEDIQKEGKKGMLERSVKEGDKGKSVKGKSKDGDSKGKSVLRGNIKDAKFRNGVRGNTLNDLCDIKKEHSNDNRSNTKDGPCEGKDGQKKMFELKDGWNSGEKVKTPNDLFLPPRRQHFCTSNLEHLNTGNKGLSDGTLASHSLLGDVLLSAKFEAEFIKKRYKDQSGYKDKETVCRAMKYSFADIGDIIKGTDLWDRDRGEKKTQNTLVQIFKQIKEQIVDQTIKGKYTGDTEDNKYINLRKDWWEANRDQIWKAMQCKTTINPPVNIKCGDTPPLVDYIPQRLRWMTEWSEWYCKVQKEAYKTLERECRECKEMGGQCMNGTEKCMNCMKACGEYWKKIKPWKKQWETISAKYEKLYKEAEHSVNGTHLSGGITDDNDKDVVEFLKKLCKQNKDSNKIYSTAEGYVHQELPDMGCKEQTLFCKNSNGKDKEKYAFRTEPYDHDDLCDCGSKTPKGTVLREPCTIVDGILNKEYGEMIIGCCEPKTEEPYAQWKCNQESGLVTEDGICMPPRRQKLCLYHLTELSDAAKEEDLRDAFIKSAAEETFLLWQYYKSKNDSDAKILDRGLIPPQFLRSMMYTFGDYKDICLDTDISAKTPEGDLAEAKGKISAVFKKIGSKIPGAQNGISRKWWWDEYGAHIWEGMLCGLSYASANKDNVKNTLIQNYHYKTVTFTSTSDGPTLSEFAERPPFLRWFTEWGEHFCTERITHLEILNMGCKECILHKDDKTCDKTDEGCKKCTAACEEYERWLETWKEHYNKQKVKFLKDKDKGKDDPDVTDSKHAYEYLGKKLKNITCINARCDCMNEKSTQNESDNIPASLDYPPIEIQGKCTCVPDKCSGLSVTDSGFPDGAGFGGGQPSSGCSVFEGNHSNCPTNETCKNYTQNIKGCPKKTYTKSNSWLKMNNKNNEFLMVPPRTKQICLQNLTRKLKHIKNEKVFKEQLLISAASEAQMLGEQYSKESDKAIEAMKYSFADIGNIIKGDSILGKGISAELHHLIKRNEIINTPSLWWRVNKHDIWQAMLCGYNSSNSNNLLHKKDGICKLPTIDNENEFVRWFIEWAENFCTTREIHIQKMKTDCNTNVCDGSKSYDTKKQKCNTACQKYRAYIKEKSEEYDRQKSRFKYIRKELKDAQSKDIQEYFKDKCNEKCKCITEIFTNKDNWDNPMDNIDTENFELKKKCECSKHPGEYKDTCDGLSISGSGFADFSAFGGGVSNGKCKGLQGGPPKKIENPPSDNTSDILTCTIPFGIALALGSIAFLFIKKKPKSPVDLIRVLDIHKGDYGMPTLESKNRYIPYRSGPYKGKTYIYMEGDTSGDEKYAFMSDTTDVTSSESEYEELDINDIYVPDSPKYKTLIEVVLEPSKSNGNTLGDDMVPTTNTFTDEEWNELKHDFISQYVQSRLPMDVPQYDESTQLPMNIVGNVLDDGIDEKPFITSIHDRNLYSGEEYSYNVNMSTNSMDDTKYVSNNVYSGIDLINDTLSGNQHIDIYDEVLKRKENELFGTNYKKNTSKNSVAKLTNNDPIMNQLDLLHKWLDRHKDMCEKWNNKEELLDKLNEEWNKDNDGINVPSDNRSLNTDVSIQIDIDENKGKKEFSNMDTILDNIEDDIYYDVNDDENPSVDNIPMDHNKVDVPKKVHVEMKILNNTSNGSLEPEFPISDVWNI